MATLPEYRLGWATGEDNLMLISVGTGSVARLDENLSDQGRLVMSNLGQLPSVLMGGASIDQDINCRSVGRCVFGAPIDNELGDMVPKLGDALKGEPLALDKDCGRKFLYARYDPDVSRKGLNALGLSKILAENVQALDGVAHLQEMQEVGSTMLSVLSTLLPSRASFNPRRNSPSTLGCSNGLETAWKRFETILVSDAGGKTQAEAEPKADWARHSYRILNLVDNQVRALRKRQVIDSLKSGLRQGAYWGIRTNITDYQLSDAMDCPFERALALAETPARLKRLDEQLQEKLINWGYAVCDAALRKHLDRTITKGKFPYAAGV
jgi:hypothetical protein